VIEASVGTADTGRSAGWSDCAAPRKGRLAADSQIITLNFALRKFIPIKAGGENDPQTRHVPYSVTTNCWK
jgi:hypothetical protein